MDLNILRHSCSHVLAQAVKELWPEVKLAIGPAIEDGFYYDFDKEEPFSDEDLLAIEEKMRQIIAKNEPFLREELDKAQAIKLFKQLKEDYKVQLIQDLADQTISIYKTGQAFLDLCRGPHLKSTGEIKAFKLLSVAGAYWHGIETNPMLQRIYGTCFNSSKGNWGRSWGSLIFIMSRPGRAWYFIILRARCYARSSRIMSEKSI
jgi:threonyl-tRNA synthetase